ncbi:MAG: glycine dehydrogenase (aminomethyl-transferring), partial [Rivularia sp. ALOHA_DT_140]|nr:glycine dehydrogenase (aminomethyl-transferring) [Rivularia sp. ALOHA_DT_140]
MVIYAPRNSSNDEQTLAQENPSVTSFAERHIGPSSDDVSKMLKILGFDNLEQLIDKAVPQTIRMTGNLKLPQAQSEYAALASLKEIADKNQVFRSFIGMGYYDCITPGVIQRNILE